jgi:hypothetical protein
MTREYEYFVPLTASEVSDLVCAIGALIERGELDVNEVVSYIRLKDKLLSDD